MGPMAVISSLRPSDAFPTSRPENSLPDSHLAAYFSKEYPVPENRTGRSISDFCGKTLF